MNSETQTDTTPTQTEIPDIRWSNLSPRATETLENVAIPLSHGYTTREIAEMNGTTVRQVRDSLTELRTELKDDAT